MLYHFFEKLYKLLALLKSNTLSILVTQLFKTVVMLENNIIVHNSKYEAQSILCTYQNQTKFWQIIKIENVKDFHWEKVVFPWQTILFNTIKQAKLTIYSTNNATAILTDTIPCLKLQVGNN